MPTVNESREQFIVERTRATAGEPRSRQAATNLFTDMVAGEPLAGLAAISAIR